VWVALARRTDGQRRFASDQTKQLVTRRADQTDKLRASESWVNYPLGVLVALAQFQLPVVAGFDYLAMSNLPTGAGLSSSAAIELASALAFLAAVGAETDRETLVKAARHAENHFVGVPCGILDQGVSGFGRQGHLVFIDCRIPQFSTVPLPNGAHFWIFNTHTKHTLVDGLYAERHRECMAAARSLGVNLLVEVTAATLAARESELTPTEFKRARHVIEEIERVSATVLELKRGHLTSVGQLLTASHRSSQRLFENSTPELDFLVDTLVTTPEIYGARLTGGGFGGAVMALTTGQFAESHAREVANAYEKKFQATPDILHMQTGDGAQRVAL